MPINQHLTVNLGIITTLVRINIGDNGLNSITSIDIVLNKWYLIW